MTIAQRIAARLVAALSVGSVVETYRLDAGEPDRYRWITIGGGPKGEDGRRSPKGFPVEIDENGKILKSRAAGLQGKNVSQVKEHFDEQRKSKRQSGRDEHDVDGGVSRPSVRRVPDDANRIKTAHEGVGPQSDHSRIPESVHGHLTDDQKHGAALAVAAMNDRGGFLLADGTGVGKTRQALAVAKTMAEAGRKVLIVTPKSVAKADFKKGTISGSWQNDSKTMGIPVTLTKGEEQLQPGQVAMTTYDNLLKIKDKIDKNTSIIFDEAHAFKNWDSARAKHGADMSKAAHSVLYATATPADKVEHIGYLARAGVFGGIGPVATFQKMGMKQVDQHVGGGKYIKKWVVDGKVGAAGVMQRMSALFEQLTREGLMIRREISLDGVQVQQEHVHLPPEAHAAMSAIKEAIGEDDGLSKARMLMAQRRQQEPYKVKHAVDSAMADIQSGHQVVIFASRVNASEVEGQDGETAVSSEGTMKLLKEEFARRGISDVAEIHGGVKDTEGEMNKFQGGSARVVIATVESGGTGINLDDVSGDKPRSLIMLTAPFSAVENVQAAGRVWRRTTKSYPKVKYLFGDTDVDRWNADLIAKKMKTLGAAVSGELANQVGTDSDTEGSFEWGPLRPEPPKREASPSQSTTAPPKGHGSFSKLKNGDWGARFEGAVKPGEQHTVRTKAGQVKTVRIKDVVWSGDGVSLVSIYERQDDVERYATQRTMFDSAQHPRDAGGLFATKSSSAAKTEATADAIKEPDAKPIAKPAPGVAGQQQSLFGGKAPAGGQQSLFNVAQTAKPKKSAAVAEKIAGRLGELLGKKDTISPADLSVPLAPASLPGQRQMFARSGNPERYEKRWITLGKQGEENRTRIQVDDDGRVTAGPPSLKGDNIRTLGDKSQAKTRTVKATHAKAEGKTGRDYTTAQAISLGLSKRLLQFDAAKSAGRVSRVATHSVIGAMQQAHDFLTQQADQRERAKERARKLTRLNAGVIASIENAHRDHSSVPGFDEAAHAVASEHPELGFDPDDTDTPAKVWELIREGASPVPALHSPEVAALAAEWQKPKPKTRSKTLSEDDIDWDAVPFSRSGF